MSTMDEAKMPSLKDKILAEGKEVSLADTPAPKKETKKKGRKLGGKRIKQK